MVSLAELHLRACRARIARAAVSAADTVTIGGITLRPAQREAIARVRRHLDAIRGCLLADDVGRGKTFVALAVARRWRDPLVVIPASLRDTWHDAMRRAGVSYPFVTHEALSNGGVPDRLPDGVIVDESHRFRNPRTRRHGALADLAMRAEVLMLSATPIQNSVADLAAQLAIFLGSAAMALDVHELVRHVVRVDADDAEAGLPVVRPPRWAETGADDGDVLRAILELPPPPRALDAGDAGVLRTIALVRAWSSSRAALASSVARRRRWATAIEQSIDEGRIPMRAELRSWQGGDEDTQLGFPSLLVAHRGGEGLASLRVAVDHERDALAGLAALLRTRADVDVERARRLASIADEHRGVRVIAFTQFASTARVYHALLRTRPQVALLTAGESRIASGRITRRELLARFAPGAQGYAEPAERERISLLISTDLLSEGVNLQDAGVVVHLDLPWNPARLSQRVGRLRRPSGCAEVASYLIAPPADAEVLLAVEARLRRKLADANRSLGRGIEIVPTLSSSGAAMLAESSPGLAALNGAMQARLARWAGAGVSDVHDNAHPIAGAASADVAGWLAVLSDGSLLASCDREISDDGSRLDRALRAAEGPPRPVRDGELERALVEIDAHLRARSMIEDCGVGRPVAPIVHDLERRLASTLPRVPRHARPEHFARAAALRSALAAPMSLGTERALQRLLIGETSVLSSSVLERAIALLGMRASRPARPSSSVTPRALILLSPRL